MLAQFARAHPLVAVEVLADRNAVLVEQLARKRLDIALGFGDARGRQVLPLGTVPVVWIGHEVPPKRLADPVPLVVFEAPCVFRQAAIEALEAAGKRWRVAFSSPSLSSQWAAVEAGPGVSVRTPLGLRGPLKVLDRRHGLPSLAPIGRNLQWCDEAPGEPVQLLRAILVDALREAIALGGFASRLGKGARAQRLLAPTARR